MSLASIRARLQQLAEPDYAAFSRKLLPGTEGVIGVRLPKLRTLSKKSSPEGEPLLEEFFGAVPESFEETMLLGMLIGAVKLPEEKRLKWVKRFIPRIDNWSVCDSFCVSLKAVGKNRSFYRGLIEELLQRQEEYAVRCGLVMILNWYLVPEEIDWVLEKLGAFSHSSYYAQMGAAWCGSIAYLKFPEKTGAFLEKDTLDPFTHNKMIQKICESRRVDSETREGLRKLKR